MLFIISVIVNRKNYLLRSGNMIISSRIIRYKELVMENKVFQPSALGLFGLAMVTFVASAQKFGWIEGTMPVVAWAICLGATAQLIAAIYDARNGVTFGATAFFGYAVFWYAIGLTWLFGNDIIYHGSFDSQLGFAFVGYLIFTVFMTIGALKTTKVLFVIFVLIDLLFIGLSVSAFTGSELFHYLSAYSELALSLLSFYAFGAHIVNEQFQKEILPFGSSIA